jgi:hypothetical protein
MSASGSADYLRDLVRSLSTRWGVSKEEISVRFPCMLAHWPLERAEESDIAKTSPLPLLFLYMKNLMAEVTRFRKMIQGPGAGPAPAPCPLWWVPSHLRHQRLLAVVYAEGDKTWDGGPAPPEFRDLQLWQDFVRHHPGYRPKGSCLF